MADGGRPKIVVAEDDEGILELLVTRLELGGYQTFIARDGSVVTGKPQACAACT